MAVPVAEKPVPLDAVTSRLVKERSPATVVKSKPDVPTPPPAPIVVLPPETVWNVPPGVASNVTELAKMPAPLVAWFTVLFAKPVTVSLLPVKTTPLAPVDRIFVLLLKFKFNAPLDVVVASKALPVSVGELVFQILFCTSNVSVAVPP